MNTEQLVPTKVIQKLSAEAYGVTIQFKTEKLPPNAAISGAPTATATAVDDTTQDKTAEVFDSPPTAFDAAAQTVTYNVKAGQEKGSKYWIFITIPLTVGGPLQEWHQLEVA